MSQTLMEAFISSTQRRVAVRINTWSNGLNIDFKTIGKLKGACGSIKQMALSDSSPYLASVSLDRYLRYTIYPIILSASNSYLFDVPVLPLSIP